MTNASTLAAELEALRLQIHADIDATPIHEVRARYVASNQTDAMAGILLSYLTRNEQYENEHRHEEKSALAEALSV
jgi:hypothetical protein